MHKLVCGVGKAHAIVRTRHSLRASKGIIVGFAHRADALFQTPITVHAPERD